MAPVLQHPDSCKPIMVEVDSSELRAGAVLSQPFRDRPKLHPGAFVSRKISPAEQNCDISNQSNWHWKSGNTGEREQHTPSLFTKHRNLEYLKTAKCLNPLQARWTLFSSISPCHIDLGPKAPRLNPCHANTLLQILRSALSPSCPLIFCQCHNLGPQPGNHSPTQASYPNHLSSQSVQCVTTSLRLTHYVGPHHACYWASRHTEDILSTKYWWLNMWHDIHNYISSCSSCAQAKIPRTFVASMLMPLPQCPWPHGPMS